MYAPAAKLGRAPEDIIKLDANENPYGPPPEVLQALGGMQFPNIYPDPESRALRAGLATYCGVPDSNILVCSYVVCHLGEHKHNQHRWAAALTS